MSLVKQLIDEIEEINKKGPQWKWISDEYPLANELNHIIVSDGKTLEILTSKALYNDVIKYWTNNGLRYYWGSADKGEIGSISSRFVWWMPIELPPKN